MADRDARSDGAIADAEGIQSWRRRGNIAIGLSLLVSVLSVIALGVSVSTRQDLAPNVAGGSNTCIGRNAEACDRSCLANQPRLVVVDAAGHRLKIYCVHSSQTPSPASSIPDPGQPGGVPPSVLAGVR